MTVNKNIQNSLSFQMSKCLIAYEQIIEEKFSMQLHRLEMIQILEL